MIFPDTPEARRELERQLDPDDPILLESDRNRVLGNLTDLKRIVLRSIRAMSPEEKASLRASLRATLLSPNLQNFTADDLNFLKGIGIKI